MIFIYLIIILSLGPTFLQILEKFHLFSKKEINLFETISLELISSLLIFVVYMLLIGYLGIHYSFYIFIPIIINFIYQVTHCLYFLLVKKRKNFKIKLNINFSQTITILLMIAILFWILYDMFCAITIYNIYPDEYAVWLLNPKNIFLGKKMNFFMNTGLEVYPNFLPLLFSGYYYFINNIEENSVRIFSSLFMLIAIIGLIGLGKEKKINLNYLLISIIFCFINYEIFSALMISTYGDIAFLGTYTVGMLYLFEWLVGTKKKEYLIISMINIMAYSFIKTEALYLVCFNILLLIMSSLFYKKLSIEKISNKSIIIYSLFTLFLPISWKIYNILAKFPSHLFIGGTGTFNFQYTVSLFTNMSRQFFGCIPWVIFLSLFIIGSYCYGNKLKKSDQQFILLGIITILANIAFLIMSYLLVFGTEALTAASFIRYMTRVFFIMVFISLISIKPFSLRK